MRTIRSIPYATDFYWKGIRYTQVIRPKTLPGQPKPKVVICSKKHDICDGFFEMPLGIKVKPVIRINNAEKKV